TFRRMSDELRSAPGHRPEQRRNRGAPSWWADLERLDLPEDHTDSTSGPAPPRPPAPRRHGPRRSSDRLARWRAAPLGGVPHLDPDAWSSRLERVRAVPDDARGGPERRFRVASARRPEEGGAPDDAPVLRQLATAPVAGIGRIVYASNAVFLLELEAEDPI